jgi:hypothetical protein
MHPEREVSMMLIRHKLFFLSSSQSLYYQSQTFITINIVVKVHIYQHLNLRKMVFFNINHTIFLFLYLLIIFILSSVNSIPLEREEGISLASTPSEYKRLATHCYIDDYAAWLERQQELMIWLSLAKLFKLPIQDSELIQQELRQFRLQHECLRVIERLPVSVGPG